MREALTKFFYELVASRLGERPFVNFEDAEYSELDYVRSDYAKAIRWTNEFETFLKMQGTMLVKYE